MEVALFLIKGAVIVTLVLILFFSFRIVSEFKRGLFAKYFMGFIVGMIPIFLAWIIDLSFMLSGVGGLSFVPRALDLLGFIAILLSIISLIARLLNPYDGVDL